MSFSSTANNPISRGAIALNNIGVSLLERGCFHQGLQTLTDATTAMKSALSPAPSKEQEATILQRVSAMLERAHKRTSQPSPMMVNNEQCSIPSFRMLSLNDCHEHIVLEEQQLFLEPIYPIRIEDVSPDDRAPGSLDNRDVQAAITLHNFGIANLCVAQVSVMGNNESKQGQRLVRLKQAIHLFQLSDEILDQACADVAMASEEEEEEQCDDEYEFVLRQMACIHMAILVSLVRALALSACCVAASASRNSGVGSQASAQLQNQAVHVHERLQSLRSTVNEMDEQFFQYAAYNTQIQTAAAA